MKNKPLIIILVFLLLIASAVIITLKLQTDKLSLNDNTENYNSENVYKNVVDTLYAGINQAKAEGNYRCCIEPDCTMCYLSANIWNYNTPGTCACDDFIARGEEPCPQCAKGLGDIHSEKNTYCDINATTSTCSSSK